MVTSFPNVSKASAMVTSLSAVSEASAAFISRHPVTQGSMSRTHIKQVNAFFMV
jgi:hypothetical protein